MKLARSGETGIRHISAMRAVSRIELAEYLFKRLGLEARFRREKRDQQPTPHLGHVELKSIYEDALAIPLPCVVESEDTSLIGEVA